MVKNQVKMYEHYCTGCGLCHSSNGVKLKANEKGFFVPKLNSNIISNFCQKVCPANGISTNEERSNIWGNYVHTYSGYSNDETLRYKSSSGGALSEIASYLLETKKVDSVIHIFVTDKDPISTKTFCSITRSEIIERCGSRYITSSPLYDIYSKVEKGKKYAFIGRPCDIVALKNYMHEFKTFENEIIYTLSFFCAGTPSRAANVNLIKDMGCSVQNCMSFKYRGDGWPGYATAVDKEGNKYKAEYNIAWGKYLGRDIMPICRLCTDGIGKVADITCADLWYLNSEGKPDFSEHNGRNVIFTRTSKGDSLLQEIASSNRMTLDYYDEKMKDFYLIQTHQFDRTITLYSQILAMKLLGRKYPNYNVRTLKNFSELATLKRKCKIFFGTIKRIVQRKI